MPISHEKRFIPFVNTCNFRFILGTHTFYLTEELRGLLD